MTIDKRIPFGFLGEWGKVYKLYNSDVKVGKVLRYQRSNYVDIGQDVQFRCAGNRTLQTTQTVKNLASESEAKTIETSDATWDNGRYKCVVAVGDIIWYDNLYWVAENIKQEEVYYPSEQAVWTIGMKRIYEEILIGE